MTAGIVTGRSQLLSAVLQLHYITELSRSCFCTFLQLESCLNGLEERLRQYHSICHRLGLLPASAKRAAGVAYDMTINRAATTQAELISGDLKVGLVQHTSLSVPNIVALSNTYVTHQRCYLVLLCGVARLADMQSVLWA